MIKFGMSTMNMTQGNHYGAYDFAGANTGIEPWYAYDTPFTVADTYDVTGRVFWSNNKIKYRDGSYDYVSILMWHENKAITKLNQVIPIGSKMYEEGDWGHATGNHIHLFVTKGKKKAVWNTRGGQNYWEFPSGSTINPNQVFYLGNTKLVNSQGIDFARDNNELKKYCHSIYDCEGLRYYDPNAYFTMQFDEITGCYSDEYLTNKISHDFKVGEKVQSKAHRTITKNGINIKVHKIEKNQHGATCYFPYREYKE